MYVATKSVPRVKFATTVLQQQKGRVNKCTGFSKWGMNKHEEAGENKSNRGDGLELKSM